MMRARWQLVLCAIVFGSTVGVLFKVIGIPLALVIALVLMIGLGLIGTDGIRWMSIPEARVLCTGNRKPLFVSTIIIFGLALIVTIVLETFNWTRFVLGPANRNSPQKSERIHSDDAARAAWAGSQ